MTDEKILIAEEPGEVLTPTNNFRWKRIRTKAAPILQQQMLVDSGAGVFFRWCSLPMVGADEPDD